MRSLRVVAVVCSFALLAAACSGETSASTTSTTTPVPTTTTLPPDPAVDGPVLRVGLTTSITTANWWAALDTAPTPENLALLTNTKVSLFTLAKPGFVLVPALAASPMPTPVTQQGSIWVVEQPLREGVEWSDGELVTAEDLVFYFEVVREFDLGGLHAANFPAEVTDVSAVDDFTVRVEFSEDPSLTTWETGVAMAPLVPAHFWASYVEDARATGESARSATSDDVARAAIATASLADADPGNDLTSEAVTPTQVSVYKAGVAAEACRQHLYSIESPLEPSAGSLIFESWVDEVAVSRSNPDYYARGTETTVYSDGSVRVAGPVVGDEVYGGEASGRVEAHHVVGPFVSAVRWRSFDTEDAAYAALTDGEVDFVYDPDGISLTRYNELAGDEGVGLSLSPADGFRFLAFNLRKPPMSDPVFRQAVATLIDKELVASSLFNGTLFPAYTVVPPALTAFHSSEVDRPGWSGGEPMTEALRYQTAITMLSDAGYTWDVQPEVVYDAGGTFIDVTPGIGLEMPNGVDVPELIILTAPGSGDDPVRATYALWIEQWMSVLGINISTETTDLATAADVAIQPDSADALLSWDLHVLGWGGPNLALPGLTLVALFHSNRDVAAGGLNTTGYASAEFDTAADSFANASSLEEAARWTKEMERIVAADLPYVTLYRPAVIEGYSSDVTFPVDAIIGGHALTGRAWPASVRIDR